VGFGNWAIYFVEGGRCWSGKYKDRPPCIAKPAFHGPLTWWSGRRILRANGEVRWGDRVGSAVDIMWALMGAEEAQG
jgi:hypothetical protein